MGSCLHEICPIDDQEYQVISTIIVLVQIANFFYGGEPILRLQLFPFDDQGLQLILDFNIVIPQA